MYHMHIIGWAIEFKFLAWSSIGQSVCQRTFSLLEIRFQRPWVRILYSAEEDSLCPFESKIACLCLSIAINNNKHVYRQRQVRKPSGSGVKWAECLLIVGMGYWIQVFNLILNSSVGLSAGIQPARESVPETLVRILHPTEEDNLHPIDCLCQSIEFNNKHVVLSLVYYLLIGTARLGPYHSGLLQWHYRKQYEEYGKINITHLP